MAIYESRYYQTDAINAVWNYFDHQSGNPIIAHPTGTGKSVIIGNFLKGIYERYPTQRVMMLTHVKKLIEQNFEKLLASWPTAPAGIYSAGLSRRETHNKITFAGIQSVAKRPHEFGHIDLILIDECHLVSDAEETSYFSFIQALLKVNPFLKVIGLSATPYRLGMGLLTEGKIFTDICHDITDVDGFNKLISEGYLGTLIPKHTTEQIDLSEVGTRGGEFIAKDAQKASDKEEITYRALKECMECGYDRNHWLVFSTGIEHCENISAMMDELGIENDYVHSKRTDDENSRAERRFKSGSIQALINVDTLTTGYDFPEIDMIVMLRPTKSAGLWVQMLGRGTRVVYAPGFDLSTTEGRLSAIAASCKQNCLVMDFAGNTARLGPINDPMIPKKKGASKGGGVAPVRLCKECNAYSHASARVCEHCGAEFPKAVGIYEEASSRELIAVKSSQPQVELFDVTKVIYTLHRKMDRPDSVKATYYCGLRKFTGYICFEHGGKAGGLAKRWWKARSDIELPLTTNYALEIMDKAATPTRLRIWINRKYPEILQYEINGEFI